MSGKIPLNLFGLPCGLTGLGAAWVTAADYTAMPVGIGRGVMVGAAFALIVVSAFYLRWILSPTGSLRHDLADPIGGPFAALPITTAMILIFVGLAPVAPQVSKVLLDFLIVMVVILGGWMTGIWIDSDLNIDNVHAGYFLPTVAGGLISAEGAATLGQHLLAQVLFGLGIVSWLLVGAMILLRLFTRPPMPMPLWPSLAILMAPPAVASGAWFSMNGPEIDFTAAALGGYGLLMIVTQVRLIRSYRRLPFMPSFWSFTFPATAVATTAIQWLAFEKVAGAPLLTYGVLLAISLLVGGIGVRTLIALHRHDFLTSTAKPPGRDCCAVVGASDDSNV